MVDISKLTKKRLGELLKEEGVISEEHVQEALERQKETGDLLGRALIELGHVTEEDIARVVCTQFGLPFVDVMNYDPNTDLLELIPEEFIQKYSFLPLDKIGDVIVIAVSGIFNEEVFRELEELTEAQIQIVISTKEKIEQALVTNLGFDPNQFSDVDETKHYERDPDHEAEAAEEKPSAAAGVEEEAEEIEQINLEDEEEEVEETEPVGAQSDDGEEAPVYEMDTNEDGELEIIDLEAEAERTGTGKDTEEEINEEEQKEADDQTDSTTREEDHAKHI